MILLMVNNLHTISVKVCSFLKQPTNLASMFDQRLNMVQISISCRSGGWCSISGIIAAKFDAPGQPANVYVNLLALRY